MIEIKIRAYLQFDSSIYLTLIALVGHQHLKTGEKQSYDTIWLPGKTPLARKG
jgi:hypothetical protein